MLKIHAGCGSIYLSDYENIDAWGGLTGSYIPNNPTTLENYYTTPFERDPSKRQRFTPVIDKRVDICKPWPYENNTVDEIVMICCIEHHTYQDACFIRDEIYRILKQGGKWLVDFPDEKKDFELYFESDPNYYFELIHCNGKNEFSVHRWGYTYETFKKFLGEGWSTVQRDIVKHDYPMIGVEATKL